MSTTPIRVSFGNDSVICGRGSGMGQFGTEHPITILSQKKDFGCRMSDVGRLFTVHPKSDIRHPKSIFYVLQSGNSMSVASPIASQARFTGSRWLTVWLMVAVSALSYFDRTIMSIAGPTVMKEFSIS